MTKFKLQISTDKIHLRVHGQVHVKGQHSACVHMEDVQHGDEWLVWFLLLIHALLSLSLALSLPTGSFPPVLLLLSLFTPWRWCGHSCWLVHNFSQSHGGGYWNFMSWGGSKQSKRIFFFKLQWRNVFKHVTKCTFNMSMLTDAHSTWACWSVQYFLSCKCSWIGN